ncbi:TRAP transporter substrate-binding protein [Roseomonas sp. ACRSG]|nr:TRAP transporter substrate-binding protein [Roseomonas sp. ACRSG]
MALPYLATVTKRSSLPKPPGRHGLLRLVLAGLAAVLLAAPARPQNPPLHLQVVGGLADVRLYEQYERPFWREELPRITGGMLQADIVPFDSSGIRGQDMLHLMRLGVMPFGTALLSLVGGDEPELAAPNLAMLAPELSTLRRVVQVYRLHLTALLKERYGVELLAIYAYPAQVLFCADPLPGLESLRGRRVRVSNPSQADAMEALGAIAVQTPFASQATELREGRIDCTITGSLSGNELGLHRLTQQIHPMAISWGLSVFGANTHAWEALPEEVRQALRRGLARLELAVWAAAGQDTEDGFLCNAGRPGCQSGTRGTMRWEATTSEDETVRRRLLAEAVIPGWIARCGEDCRQAWNTHLAPSLRIFLPEPKPAGKPGARLVVAP